MAIFKSLALDVFHQPFSLFSSANFVRKTIAGTIAGKPLVIVQPVGLRGPAAFPPAINFESVRQIGRTTKWLNDAAGFYKWTERVSLKRFPLAEKRVAWADKGLGSIRFYI